MTAPTASVDTATRPDEPLWHTVSVVDLFSLQGVEEQAGLKMIVQLIDGMSAELAIGAPVEVVFEDVADGMSVPHFQMRAQS